MPEPHSPQEIISLLHNPALDTVRLISSAYEFSKKIHKDKKRLSGEPYLVHSIETAKTLANLKMDAPTIAAGLLHNTVYEEGASIKDLQKEFGEEVAFLVESMSKLDRIRYQGSEKYVENLRKLFIVMAKDIRVLIIRLAHRLHNIQTLRHIPKEKWERIALETLEIYAPIANRLGMRKLKGELEDAAFPYVFPKEYKETLQLLEGRRELDEKYLEKSAQTLEKELKKHGVTQASISYRKKHLYRLYEKLSKKYDMDASKLHDIYALRVVVKTVPECYQALGLIHALWTPLPGQLTDYIASPKPNGYQSIHTEVSTGEKNILEIQIRTETMDFEAEYGIASHLAYTEGKWRPGNILSKKLRWIKQLIDWQRTARESKEVLRDLQMDFFQDRVFTFTPKGDVIELPSEATPIDFAYAIHSDIGNHAFGAKVNNTFAALDSKLKNGDVVEIQTRKNSAPTQKWLTFAKTSLARKHIKGFLANQKKS